MPASCSRACRRAGRSRGRPASRAGRRASPFRRRRTSARNRVQACPPRPRGQPTAAPMSSGRFRRPYPAATEEDPMGKVRFSISTSIDAYIAGPDPSLEHPLGVGGEQLHEWALALEAWRRPHGLEGGEVNESTPVMEAAQENVGAYVMGRNMFGGGPGDWGDDPWNGWWSDDPPFHAPVFVVTHHARE